MKNPYLFQILSALVAGLLFGIGLIVSRMIDPKKVMDFLDVFGDWDASLAFVMIGAVGVTSIGYRVLFRRSKPLFAEMFSLPRSTKIDKKLVIGAALFGIGWGLAGLCPGPALTGISLGVPSILLFVLFMIAGINLYRFITALI